jgi:hypothetical protein
MVVSVPKKSKCLSGVDTKVCLEAVGALATIAARVSVAASASEFHVKVAPSTIVAISLFPKLSRDHRPGAIIVSPLTGLPH